MTEDQYLDFYVSLLDKYDNVVINGTHKQFALHEWTSRDDMRAFIMAQGGPWPYATVKLRRLKA